MASTLSTPAKLPTRKLVIAKSQPLASGHELVSRLWTAPPDEERYKVLDYIYERGVTFWDTADCYGDNEEIIGECETLYSCTKFGLFSDPNRFVNGTPEYVRKAAEKSLKRLGVETVDLYYYHRPDPTVPIEKTVEAMAELVTYKQSRREGRVRYLGLSECSAATLRRAHAVHPITAIQDPKVGLLETARELGVTIVHTLHLGEGPEDFTDDFRLSIGRFSKENFPNILKIVDVLKRVAEPQGATVAQAALAWVLAQGGDVIPIPGSTKIKRIEENVGSLSVKITEEEAQEDVQFGDTPAL
ncbi:NADP-dependent oxidoreductase domain-containing protein [Irpex lacteus]|nr:NADP-dependent oxidoreductase domain-containing protein [Irpex lacteus]